MGRSARYLVFVCVVVSSLALSYAAYLVAGMAWDAVVEYRSPYIGPPASPAQTGPAVSQRVVLVIVDGLRLDAAQEMAALSRMSDYASEYVLTAPQPSLSYPNWTTILSGAPPYISGVVTNWHEGAAPVQTLFDAARSVDATYVVVGPSDLVTLFPAAADADGSFLRPWTEEYMAETYVDATLELVADKQPRLAVLHIPDIDEAGHNHGGASSEYADVVAKVDADLRRLVEGLQGDGTTFIIVTDHGHIDSGGHGGWEDEVVSTSGIFGGQGVHLGSGAADLEDVAPTTAVLAGLPVPAHSSGRALAAVVAPPPEDPSLTFASEQRDEFTRARIGVVLGDLALEQEGVAIEQASRENPDEALERADALRLSSDRASRLPYGGAVIVASLLIIALVGAASWRALAAALAGTASYYFVYNVAFFVVHGHRWSLSAFNSEDLIGSWMNARMAEAVIAGLISAIVAGFVYPLFRRMPMGPRGTYMPGWLTLGPATVLVTQATLAIQVGWFVWWWGLSPEWRLPDLQWAFKADLDMVQATALGAAALVTPIVTYLVGRYHPKVTLAPKQED